MDIIKVIDDDRGPITYTVQRALDNWCNEAESHGWSDIPFLGFFCVTWPVEHL